MTVEPDYRAYSEEELEGVVRSIEQDRFPERFKRATDEFNKRKSTRKQFSRTPIRATKELSLYISRNNHIEHLIPSAVLFLFMLIVPLLASKNITNPETAETIYRFVFYFFGIPILLALFLHLCYYFNDKNTEFSTMGEQFSIKLNNTVSKFSLAEVESFVMYQTISARFNGVRYIPSENYNIGVINLRSGESYKLTTLLDPDFKVISKLFADKAVTKLRPICFV